MPLPTNAGEPMEVESQVFSIESVDDLGKDFKTALVVISNPQYADASHWERWVPAWCDRVRSVADAGIAHASTDLISLITSVASEIVSHLSKNFMRAPPFTAPRAAELLLSPEEQGYRLALALHVLNYLRSLSRVLLVSSSILDYPQEYPCEEQDVGPHSTEISWSDLSEVFESKECDIEKGDNPLDLINDSMATDAAPQEHPLSERVSSDVTKTCDVQESFVSPELPEDISAITSLTSKYDEQEPPLSSTDNRELPIDSIVQKGTAVFLNVAKDSSFETVGRQELMIDEVDKKEIVGRQELMIDEVDKKEIVGQQELMIGKIDKNELIGQQELMIAENDKNELIGQQELMIAENDKNELVGPQEILIDEIDKRESTEQGESLLKLNDDQELPIGPNAQLDSLVNSKIFPLSKISGLDKTANNKNISHCESAVTNPVSGIPDIPLPNTKGETKVDQRTQTRELPTTAKVNDQIARNSPQSLSDTPDDSKNGVSFKRLGKRFKLDSTNV